MVPDSQRSRTILCRVVIYSAPCLMAALSLSYFYLARSSPSVLVQSLVGIVALFNAALAVFASAGATIFLHGAQKLRLMGAGAYAVVSFATYAILFLTGIMTIGN
jgi:hypothetical protein